MRTIRRKLNLEKFKTEDRGEYNIITNAIPYPVKTVIRRSMIKIGVYALNKSAARKDGNPKTALFPALR
ncbi:MAG: hypothetical protein FWF68_05870 [Spirochaetes bacterium]|nr:hypothetical protein [Spirochaetota bacterium]